MILKQYGIFHVHTNRCGHAENISDEEYIKKAIDMSAKDIWFTDHAPFPGDPFGNRMKYSQLDEYISTLESLKCMYKDKITVHIGLEIEYFPSFDAYYKELLKVKEIEILLLGQHMYELNDGRFNFELCDEERQEKEMEGITQSLVQGINTGYFSVCAHPDRTFRYQKEWNNEVSKNAKMIIKAAYDKNVILEKNIGLRKKMLYRKEFWKMTDFSKPVVVGVDAHNVNDLNELLPNNRISSMRGNLTQARFSQITDIPIGTLRDWEYGRRVPAPYIIDMIDNQLDYCL